MAAVATLSNMKGLIEKICVAKDEGKTAPHFTLYLWVLLRRLYSMITFLAVKLVYEWPQGFGRFALDAMNPNIGKLDNRYKEEIEGILGTKLRVIYQHI